MEKYKVFLGSEIAKTYDEAKNFTLARVDEYTEFNHKELFSTLAPIDNFTGNVFSLIHYLNDFHRALASKYLLENNISGFKKMLLLLVSWGFCLNMIFNGRTTELIQISFL